MDKKPARPAGLSLIAAFWFIYGLVNVCLSFQTISADLEVLPLLSNASGWFSFGVPAELVLAILVLCLGLLQLIAVPGLWIGKPYSYRLSLIVPALLLVSNVCSVGLYASAPVELDLGFDAVINLFPLFTNIVWVVVFWQYLRRSYVKTFFGITKL